VLDKQLNAMRAQTKQDQARVAQLQTQLTATQKQLQQQQATVTELQQQTSGKQDQWLLAEINYLVQQANYHLRFARDVSTALALLETADQRFAMLDNPKLLNLRELLTKAIGDLQALPKVDTAGILLKLNNLQQQVTQLPLLVPKIAVEKSATDVESNKITWRQALQSSWQALSQIIVVRRIDQPITPLLSVQEQTYLQQNIQLLLQQAGFAALRNENDAYQNSLRQAQMLIQRYYLTTAPLTEGVTKALAALQAINVTPSLPDLTNLAQATQQAKQGA
jgi:uroporphyrin-3 C-methyltransferase